MQQNVQNHSQLELYEFLQLRTVLDQMIGGSLVESKLEEVHASIQVTGA